MKFTAIYFLVAIVLVGCGATERDQRERLEADASMPVGDHELLVLVGASSSDSRFTVDFRGSTVRAFALRRQSDGPYFADSQPTCIRVTVPDGLEPSRVTTPDEFEIPTGKFIVGTETVGRAEMVRRVRKSVTKRLRAFDPAKCIKATAQRTAG